MTTYPLRINLNDIDEYTFRDFIPTTNRYNSLSDIELNFIENTIKTQNLKNYMSLKINNIQRKFDDYCTC